MSTNKYIIKRDGRKVLYNRRKIENAMSKAFIAKDGEIDDYAEQKIKSIADFIEDKILSEDKEFTVEEIQNLVQNGLMNTKRKDVAEAYIVYRNDRNRIRMGHSDLIINAGKKLLGKNNEMSNANVDEDSFGGRMGEANSVLTKQYALDYIISDKVRKNHLDNRIYIHDLNSYATGMHNCFQRNTYFLTNYGICSFENFVDGSQIKVLAVDGVWRDATVRCYGRQKMQHVTFQRCGKIKEVNCTSNHRWILSDGTVTENLSIGDTLCTIPNVSNNWICETQRDAEMFAFGFVIGDGCDHYISNTNLHMQARLCGDKTKYSSIFEAANYRSNSIKNSNDIMYTKSVNVGKQIFLTNKLWNLLSLRDKISLFNGYFAADGSISNMNTKLVWTSDERVVNMVLDIAPLAGYHIYNIKEIRNDTNYKKNRLLYEITFTTSFSNNTLWTVIDIKNQPRKDYEAWCVEEPITHSFMLADGMITGNCLSIPFDDILAKGFNTKQTDVRPANSINTAFQLVAVLFQLQSLQQFGGVSATHLDWTMVPYVRKSFFKHYITSYIKSTDSFKDLNIIDMIFDTYEETINDINGDKFTVERNRFDEWVDDHKQEFLDSMNLKFEDFYLDNDNLDKSLYQSALYDTVIELKQAVEGMYHNLNTLQSRSGNQLPFTSINYGTCTATEGRLVIRALLEGSIKGVGKLHKTPIFPCGIFQCMNGVNRKPGDTNYDLFKLAIKSTSKRLYPNYVNVDWSNNSGYDPKDPRTYTSTMGCRTYNGYDINGFGQMKDGRGNIAPSTIIMPTLAMEAVEAVNGKVGDGTAVEEFMKILDQAIADCRDGLIERFEYICSQSPASAKFMYENGTMYGYVPEEGIRSALKHGTLAIGQLGLAETLQILIGKNQLSEEGFELGKRIEALFNRRCKEFKEKYKLNFGVYLTPAESLCYTAMSKFKQEYGELENISTNSFFTNSTHVPVWEEVSPFEKIDVESVLDNYSNAGSILYIELDSDAIHNLDAIETYVTYAMDHDVPYFAINIPNDTCLECGYTGEFNDKCPVCGSTHIQQLRRVTGYLTGNYKTAFNLGKQEEVELRYKHTKKLHKDLV